jgi:hypothetical protein
VDEGVGVRSTGLDEQDVHGGIFAEPVGEHAARRSSAHDHVVIHRHRRRLAAAHVNLKPGARQHPILVNDAQRIDVARSVLLSGGYNEHLNRDYHRKDSPSQVGKLAASTTPRSTGLDNPTSRSKVSVAHDLGRSRTTKPSRGPAETHEATRSDPIPRVTA